MVLTISAISVAHSTVLPARGKCAQWWNIHGNGKDSTYEVICYTSFEVCLEFLDALKWVLFLFVCAERVTERTHAHMVLVGVSAAPFAPRCHSFPLLYEFSLPLRALEDPKNLWFMYTSYLSCSRLRGTWTVIPAENNTSFSPVKPSVRPHHREQALRIHDIISLPGRVVHSIFPTTLHCSKVSSARSGKKKKWEMGDSAEAQLVLISVLRGISWKQGDPRS